MLHWTFKCIDEADYFDRAVRKHDIGVVVLRSTLATKPMVQRLANSPRWAVTDIGVKSIVFVRRDGPDAPLAKRLAITRRNFDVHGYIRRVSAADPVPAFALHGAAILLKQMGWDNHAITVWRRCLELKKDYWEALGELGHVLALRGNYRMWRRDTYRKKNMPAEAAAAEAGALRDWREAEKLLRRSLVVKPGNKPAMMNLAILQKQMAEFERGVFKPRGAGRLDRSGRIR